MFYQYFVIEFDGALEICLVKLNVFDFLSDF